MYKIYRSVCLPLLLIAASVAFTACDSLDDVDVVIDINDQPVELGQNEGVVGVAAGQTTQSLSTVSENLDVDEIEQLEEIALEPGFFAFTESAAAGKTGDAQDTGTLTVLVSIGLPPNGPLFPLPPVTVTITNNVVTDVQPRAISLLGGSYNIAQIESLINNLPASERPNLTALGNLTIDQAREGIEDALEGGTGFLFSIVVRSEGITGTLKINELSIDARVIEN